MQMDAITQQANADIGGYIMAKYGGEDGSHLQAANAVSALGALAGVFAQAQARAMMASGALAQNASSLVEAITSDGQHYYFGDAINACLMEGTRERPAFWNMAAAVAQDPEIASKVVPAEIAGHAARVLGGPEFGVPRIDAKYALSEMPIDAVRAHAPVLLSRFRQIKVAPANLMLAFGAVAQGLAPFAAGEHGDVHANVAMPRLEIVRLYMESAIPMSKLDLRSLGMVDP
jgi:hypothetical protein